MAHPARPAHTYGCCVVELAEAETTLHLVIPGHNVLLRLQYPMIIGQRKHTDCLTRKHEHC